MLLDNIIEEARSYLGTPWKHQGRTRRGVDCVGFIILAFTKFNIYIKEIKGYSRFPDGIELKKVMDAQPNFKQVNNIIPGDIILFRIKRDPQHVALAVNSTTADIAIIHSYNGGEAKVIEHDLAPYWRSKIVSVYRLV